MRECLGPAAISSVELFRHLVAKLEAFPLPCLLPPGSSLIIRKRTKPFLPFLRKNAANYQSWEEPMFNSNPWNLCWVNKHSATSYGRGLGAAGMWLQSCLRGGEHPAGALINATPRRCVCITPGELICYTLVLNTSSCSQLILIKHACRVCPPPDI